MIQIFHNPRCGKSRDAVNFLTDNGYQFETVLYLNEITKEILIDTLQKLQMNPIDLVRKNEPIWKSEFKNKELTEDELLDLMVSNPKLIERPIVIKDNFAVVARPLENIHQLLK